MVNDQSVILASGWPQHAPDQLPPQPDAGGRSQNLQTGCLRDIEAFINYGAGAQHRDLASPKSLEYPWPLRLRGVAVNSLGGDPFAPILPCHLVGVIYAHCHGDGPLRRRVELLPVPDDFALDLNYPPFHVGRGEVAAARCHPRGVDPVRRCK